MGENEMRLAAVELVLIELLAWIDQEAVKDAHRSIRAGLDRCDDDERAVRLQAMQLLEDGRLRFGGLSGA